MHSRADRAGYPRDPRVLPPRIHIEDIMKASATPAALAVRDFCLWAGVSRSTFYKEVKEGRLQPVKLGKKTLIVMTEAERWLASLPKAGGLD